VMHALKSLIISEHTTQPSAARQESLACSFVRSFLRGGVRPLPVFQRAFSLLPALRPMRPRLVVKRSLDLAQCTPPLTLGLVLYIYRTQLSRQVSLAGANMRSSYKTTGPCHLLSTPAALTTPRRPQSGCNDLSQFKEDTGEPSVSAREFNLIACRNLTRHAVRGGRRTHTLPN